MAFGDLGSSFETIEAVAAKNIAQSIGLPERAADIEAAIADEISSIGTHFTLMFADIQAAATVRGFVEANVWLVLGAAALVFFLGVGVGFLVG